VGRGLRHYHLAECLQELNVSTTIVASSFHHLMFEPESPALGSEVNGVPYCWLDAPRYQGNGLKRLFNMLGFSVSLLKRRWRRDQKKPAVIVVSSPHLFAWLSAFYLSKRYGAKLILEVRDIWPLSLVELTGASRWHPLVLVMALCERLAYRFSDRVVSNLPYANRHMERRGMRRERFTWIPNGVKLSTAVAETEESALAARMKVLRAADRFIVFYAGAHGAPNALMQLIHAAEKLQVSRSPVSFVLVGDGDQKATLQAAAHSKGLENIEFYTSIPKIEIDRLLPLADAGLATVQDSPLYDYGVSLNKLFDYMGAKLPVIYVVPGPYQPVIEAACGVSILPDHVDELVEKIRKLSDLPADERQRMGANGFAYVQAHHDYQALAQAYKSVMFDETHV